MADYIKEFTKGAEKSKQLDEERKAGFKNEN